MDPPSPALDEKLGCAEMGKKRNVFQNVNGASGGEDADESYVRKMQAAQLC